MDRLTQELNDWTVGNIIIDQAVATLGCRLRVVCDGQSWSLLRGFMLGETPAVSVDVSEQSEARVMQALIDFIA